MRLLGLFPSELDSSELGFFNSSLFLSSAKGLDFNVIPGGSSTLFFSRLLLRGLFT